jgi:hypothetical protein
LLVSFRFSFSFAFCAFLTISFSPSLAELNAAGAFRTICIASGKPATLSFDMLGLLSPEVRSNLKDAGIITAHFK